MADIVPLHHETFAGRFWCQCRNISPSSPANPHRSHQGTVLPQNLDSSSVVQWMIRTEWINYQKQVPSLKSPFNNIWRILSTDCPIFVQIIHKKAQESNFCCLECNLKTIHSEHGFKLISIQIGSRHKKMLFSSTECVEFKGPLLLRQ